MTIAVVRCARRVGRAAALFLVTAAIGLHLLTSGGPALATTEEEKVALQLADLLRAARAVISAKQGLINDPAIGDKGLTSDVVLAETIARFKESTGMDPMAVDPDTPTGRLFQAQLAAIREVMDEAQASIN